MKYFGLILPFALIACGIKEELSEPSNEVVDADGDGFAEVEFI